MRNPDLGRAFEMAQKVDPSVTVEVVKTEQGSYTFTVTTADGKRKRCNGATAVQATAVLCSIAKVRPVERDDWHRSPYRAQHTGIFAILYNAFCKKLGVSRFIPVNTPNFVYATPETCYGTDPS